MQTVMHYYPFNIGDYRRDTSHLSMLEHGAYRQLLDQYYLKEKPIPVDVEMRTLCVRNADELRAVEYILTTFFDLDETGSFWTHRVCDNVIEKYNSKSKKAKDAARLRWDKGSKKNAKAMRTHSERNANHKPITNNQEPKNIGQMTFDLFWSAYPKRVKKKESLKIWVRDKLHLRATQIVNDVKHRLQFDGRWEGGYVPDPPTYLNGERWNDDVADKAVATKRGGSHEDNSRSRAKRVNEKITEIARRAVDDTL